MDEPETPGLLTLSTVCHTEALSVGRRNSVGRVSEGAIMRFGFCLDYEVKTMRGLQEDTVAKYSLVVGSRGLEGTESLKNPAEEIKKIQMTFCTFARNPKPKMQREKGA